MNKIRRYFTTLELIQGFFIAFVASAFIYLNYYHISFVFLDTILGLLFLYLLLGQSKKIWFIVGFFIGLFWFWWISLSLKQYGMVWAMPLELFVISLAYGLLFFAIAYLGEKVRFFTKFEASSLFIQALGLFFISTIHPFGFDWLKIELIFVNSYFGIHNWQFAIILASIILAKKHPLFLFFLVFSLKPFSSHTNKINPNIALVSTYISIDDKWNKSLHHRHFREIFSHIDKAIRERKKIVVLPESIFALYLNLDASLIKQLQERAKQITIIVGGLYWDGKTPRNSTYIFDKSKITVANKVVLVPFGEANPLPDFLSKWVNKIFYDGATDYKASKNVIRYKINDVEYTNAICFEATSEKLYEKHPKNMIVLSNNAWFIPSIEPSLQKLLLQYYSQKYHTTIYHSINYSSSYIVSNGRIIYP